MPAPVIKSVRKLRGTSSVEVKVQKTTGQIVTMRVPGKDLLSKVQPSTKR